MKKIILNTVDEKIDELIHAEAKRRGTELYGKMYSLLKQHVTDKSIANEMESAFVGDVVAAMEAGFVVGWQCAKNPEILIFEDEEQAN